MRAPRRSLSAPLALLAILLASVAWPSDEPAGSALVVRVAVGEIAGKVRVAVFASEEAWLEEAAHAKIVDVDAATVEVTFDGVAPGDYGVAIVHDSNGNGKQDRNFIGIPTEPYGFSNNPARRFGPAKWEDARFVVDGARKTIEVQVQ
jgi:uncharacterized protein (DUF2141 family)